MERFVYPLDDKSGHLEIYFERPSSEAAHINVEAILWRRGGKEPVDVAPLIVALDSNLFMFLCFEAYQASCEGENGSLQ